MHKHVKVSIRGIAPLLMHNGHIANPLNILQSMRAASREIKGATASRGTPGLPPPQ